MICVGVDIVTGCCRRFAVCKEGACLLQVFTVCKVSVNGFSVIEIRAMICVVCNVLLLRSCMYRAIDIKVSMYKCIRKDEFY